MLHSFWSLYIYKSYHRFHYNNPTRSLGFSQIYSIPVNPPKSLCLALSRPISSHTPATKGYHTVSSPVDRYYSLDSQASAEICGRAGLCTSFVMGDWERQVVWNVRDDVLWVASFISGCKAGRCNGACGHGCNECNGQISPLLRRSLSPPSSSLCDLHARHEIESGRVSHRFDCWMGYSVELMI